MPEIPYDPLPVYRAWEARRAFGVEAGRLAASRFAGAGDEAHARIAAQVAELLPELLTLSRDLFDHPESAFQEVYGAERIALALERRGATVVRGAHDLPTSLRAESRTGGTAFAIVAEYDALPGVGHACGHNVIAAIAVGAFLAASAETDGRVVFIGAPAEEAGGGKELILRAGGFDDVSAAGMVHPAAGDHVSPVYDGSVTSGVRRVRVTYRGRAAHAALSPYLGLNALDAVVTAYQSIAQLRQHILPVDRIHGVITDGGAAANVVPERAAAEFLVRSADIDTLDALMDRVVDILEAAARATGTAAEIELDFEPAYLPLRPNVELTKRWAGHLSDRGRVVPLEPAVPRVGGPSTDMGNVSWFVPTIHPELGLGGSGGASPHHPSFARETVEPPAATALADAAVALAGTAVDFLADAGLRAAVQGEFEAAGGRRRR